MAPQTKREHALPRMRQFLSAEEISFLEKKESLPKNSIEGAATLASDTLDSEIGIKDSKDPGPIKINAVIAPELSKLIKDAQLNKNITVANEETRTTTPVIHKVTGVKVTLSTHGQTTKETPKATFKQDASFLIPQSDLKAIVSQDPALRSLITQTTQKFRMTTSAKSSDIHTTKSPNFDADKPTGSTSGFFTPRIKITATSSGETTVPLLSAVLQKTPDNIPLMVGGGLAIFIIMLLVAIVVLLVRLKNKKGDISMRNESSRTNVSQDTDISNMRSRNTSTSTRRDSTDSNIYSEIGSEVRDEDIGDTDDDDDVIYYWGESEWDTDSRHNSVISLSYTAKTESARNSISTGNRLSLLGVPKRGRRKSSLLAQMRQNGSSADLRKNRQSNAGAIFCIPETEDVAIDQDKKIEIKKDDLYKKVMKEKRSQSLY